MDESFKRPNNFRALLKISLIALYGVGLVAVFIFAFGQYALFLEKSSQKRKLVRSFNYTNTNVKGYGRVIEPLVSFEIEYPSGYQKVPFLLDSGAMISSLPFEVAKEMGINLAFLPRQSFRGFGNTTSYAYRGSVKMRLSEKMTLDLPVVFTEASGTKHLLGRYGFFDDYSVEFNHIKGTIDIYQ